jgi:hypothetical protein
VPIWQNDRARSGRSSQGMNPNGIWAVARHRIFPAAGPAMLAALQNFSARFRIALVIGRLSEGPLATRVARHSAIG